MVKGASQGIDRQGIPPDEENGGEISAGRVAGYGIAGGGGTSEGNPVSDSRSEGPTEEGVDPERGSDQSEPSEGTRAQP